jgi:hypothetical protein
MTVVGNDLRGVRCTPNPGGLGDRVKVAVFVQSEPISRIFRDFF